MVIFSLFNSKNLEVLSRRKVQTKKTPWNTPEGRRWLIFVSNKPYKGLGVISDMKFSKLAAAAIVADIWDWIFHGSYINDYQLGRSGLEKDFGKKGVTVESFPKNSEKVFFHIDLSMES